MTGEFAFAKTLNWCVAEGDLPYPNGEALLLSLRSPTAPETVCASFASNQSNMLVVEPQAPPGDEKWNPKAMNPADKDANTKYQATMRNAPALRRAPGENGNGIDPGLLEQSNSKVITDPMDTKWRDPFNKSVEYSKPLFSDLHMAQVDAYGHALGPSQPISAPTVQQHDSASNGDSGLSDFVADLSACAASHYRSTIERQSRQLEGIFAFVLNRTVECAPSTSMPVMNGEDYEEDDDDEDDDDEDDDE